MQGAKASKTANSVEIDALLTAVSDPRSRIACAAARQLKALSERDRSLLHPWRKPLLHTAMTTPELRVRWNLIIVLGRLPLQAADRAATVDWIFERLAEESSLARTFALQALFDLSAGDAPLRARILPILVDAAEAGTPAMRARARKLLRQASHEAAPHAKRPKPHEVAPARRKGVLVLKPKITPD